MGGGDRRSILTDQEKKKHVDRFITKRSKKDTVQYPEVKANIENKTGKDISIQTVRRIGHELGHSSKKVKRLLESEGMFRSPFPYIRKILKKRCRISKEVSKGGQKSTRLY